MYIYMHRQTADKSFYVHNAIASLKNGILMMLCTSHNIAYTLSCVNTLDMANITRLNF